MFDFLKPYACPICGASYWLPKPAYDCCKGTPAYDAWKRQIDRRVAAAEARKRGEKVDTPRVGLSLKPCPNCNGKRINVRCPLCDGDGFVPSNMF